EAETEAGAAAAANPAGPHGRRAEIEGEGLAELIAERGAPDASVAYFKSLIEKDPNTVDNHRGLARALSRQGRHQDAARVWAQALAISAPARDADRFAHLRSLARAKSWEEGGAAIAAIPAAARWSAQDRLFAAVVLDNLQRWDEADRAYAAALRSVGGRPAPALNNWGVSQLARRDYAAAAALFSRALDADEDFGVAKTNLALAYALQGDFRLPSVPMSEVERARLYHDVGILAMRRGDREAARRLFRAAIDSHPRHYRKATDMLARLDAASGATAR
ncbi:MAG: tetratricopeptide repeat protein, partial [Pseudomonadota bacterium]